MRRRPVTQVLNSVLGVLLRAAHAILKLSWFVRRPRTYGAHALALTPAGRAVLVKLRYASGWRLPGGGRKEFEDPRDAILRELREEIGMIACGRVDLACDLEETTDHKVDLNSLLIVRDVEYKPPNWSWEVQEIVEASLDAPPDDVSPTSVRWLEAIRPLL